MLASLNTPGTTTIKCVPSRDHTEQMFKHCLKIPIFIKKGKKFDLIKVEGKAKRKAEGKVKASETRAKNKKIRNEYLRLKEKVFFNLPENIQKEIKEKERKTGFDIPTYKLKEYAKEYNIDISNE